jgi:hypothetical protein
MPFFSRGDQTLYRPHRSNNNLHFASKWSRAQKQARDANLANLLWPPKAQTRSAKATTTSLQACPNAPSLNKVGRASFEALRWDRFVFAWANSGQ